MKTQTIEDLARIIELQQEIATAELSLSDLMHLICSRTRELTGAAGAVVEMAEGDEMVYRSSCGSLENALGVRLKIATSLSGLSVTTGEVLHCEDSETDPRVDREATRRVNARSMICVPLLYHQKPIGVLKVVSPEAHKFKNRHVDVLRLIANLLSASISQAKTHQQVLDSERMFRELIAGASDGILITKDGYCLDANTTLCKMFGYEAEEIKGKWALEFVTPEVRQMSMDYIQSGYSYPYDSIGLRKDGSTFDIEILGKTLEINGERIRMTTIRDISEKKKTEIALKESEQKSREAARLKAEFLANMSHEIRTPLNGILGMTGLLIDTNLDEQQQKYLEIIRSSGDSLLSIVNDILDFSKIEAKRLVLEMIPFELRASVEDIKQILGFAASQKNLHVKIDIDPLVPKVVKGDPTRLRQILMNLLSNAIKFTSKGSITVRVTKNKKDLIRFEVIDSGIGIPKSAIEAMFKPFTQVDSSTTRRFGGTGLGLSICKELVNAMNGQIGVTSEESVGSTFWFELPLKADGPSDSAPVAKKVIEQSSKKLRVLIAEDNAVNALIGRKMVEKLGHTVTIVSNGKETLDALELIRYDLILMDCQMPEMDGFEATENIRKSAHDWKEIPIVAMTAHAMTGDRERCLAVGMNDYISKPMRIDDLYTVIEKIISKFCH